MVTTSSTGAPCTRPRFAKASPSRHGAPRRVHGLGILALTLAFGCTADTGGPGAEDLGADDATSASAGALAVGNGNFRIQSVHSARCLDVAEVATHNGAKLQQWGCGFEANKIFQFTHRGGSDFEIKARHSNRCMDVPSGQSEPGLRIQQWDCFGNGAQTFEMRSVGNDEYLIVNRASGLCLDIGGWSTENGGALVQWSCHGGANQRFRLLDAGDSPPPPPSGWRLVWRDEFDGPGVDESKWNYEVKGPGWVNQELQNYTHRRWENARVENGHLVIEARRDWFQGHEYSSARLKTHGKASWRYGRVEARIRVPTGHGTWAAFWLMPDNCSRGWPACGEIDILEHVGYEPNIIHATTHSAAYNWMSSSQRTAWTHVPGAIDGFHVYSMEWTPERIDVFVDGRHYYASTNPHWGDDWWPFDKNFHVILNLAVGGNWGGARGVDPNIWPRRMLVDYVRVYQR